MDIYIGADIIFEQQKIDQANNLISRLNPHYKKIEMGEFIIWKNSKEEGEVQYYKDEKYLIFFDGYLNAIKHSLHEHLPILANRILSGLPILAEKETGIFNIVVIERKSHNVYLASDPGALFPLYYTQSRNAFIFSSNMYIIAQFLNLKPDYLGILEELKFSYTFGSRTLYDSLYRLNPGEIIKYDHNQKNVQIKKSETYYNHYIEYGKDLVDLTWESLNSPFAANSPDIVDIGIMLSEGFDSRLIAGISNFWNLEVSAFSHGTPGTKGSQITCDVANSIGAEYHFFPLAQGLPTGHENLQSQLFLSNNLSIPYWINGSAYFSRNMVGCATTGYALDSTLGGHCFYKPARPVRRAVAQRYLEIVKQNLHLLNDDYIENLADELLINIKNSCEDSNFEKIIDYYFAPDIADEFKKYTVNVAEDFEKEIKRISSTGSSLRSEQLQRFFLEQRGRKFSFGQELTLRLQNKVIVPSFEPPVMRFLSSIHPKHRVHHALYIDLLKSKLPRLASIPNGGYGTSLNKPRWLLETLRFIQKFEEKHTMRKYLQRQGNINLGNLRPVNIIESSYRKGLTLDYLESFISENAEILNQKSILKGIDLIRNYKSKSYLVMDLYQLMEFIPPLSPSLTL